MNESFMYNCIMMYIYTILPHNISITENKNLLALKENEIEYLNKTCV